MYASCIMGESYSPFVLRLGRSVIQRFCCAKALLKPMGCWMLPGSRLYVATGLPRAMGESEQSSSDSSILSSAGNSGSCCVGRRILQVGHILTKREISSLGTLNGVSLNLAKLEVLLP